MDNEKNKENYSEKKKNLVSDLIKKRDPLALMNKLIKNLQENEQELEEAFNKKDFRRFELIKTNIRKIQRALSEELREI